MFTLKKNKYKLLFSSGFENKSRNTKPVFLNSHCDKKQFNINKLVVINSFQGKEGGTERKK